MKFRITLSFTIEADHASEAGAAAQAYATHLIDTCNDNDAIERQRINYEAKPLRGTIEKKGA